MARLCKVVNLLHNQALSRYENTWLLQKLLMEECSSLKKQRNMTQDTIIVVQHPPTFTLGRGAALHNVKFLTTNSKQNAPLLYRVERGGEVTWHGPGQLVVYPVFDLDHHKRDLHWFASSLEQVVIDTLRSYSVNAGRSEVNTGVWVEGNKICALGVTASRWITMHGIAVNLNCDLQSYAQIIPCGIDPSKGGVTRLRDCVRPPHEIEVDDFAQRLLSSFSRQFGLNLVTELNPEALFANLLNSYPAVSEQTIRSIESLNEHI